jgi:hypothetical protein
MFVSKRISFRRPKKVAGIKYENYSYICADDDSSNFNKELRLETRHRTVL